MIVDVHFIHLSVAVEADNRVIGAGSGLKLIYAGVAAQIEVCVGVQQQVFHLGVHCGGADGVIRDDNIVIALALNGAVAPKLQPVNVATAVGFKAHARFIQHHFVEIAIVNVDGAAAAHVNSAVNGQVAQVYCFGAQTRRQI